VITSLDAIAEGAAYDALLAQVANGAMQAERAALDADMSGDGWVIVSEPAWDGWRAYVDGRRLQHRIANLGYVAIFVPQGHHTVKLVYWPPAFVIGRGISAAAIAGILMFAVVHGRRKRPVAA